MFWFNIRQKVVLFIFLQLLVVHLNQICKYYVRDLDYSKVQKGGVLVEPLFYTHYDSWRALNCTDPTDFVEFNICVGIDEAIYKYLKGIPVGFEDDIQITACPDYMEQNTSVSIDACFSDYPPDNQLGWVSCKLFAATREGSVLLNETGALPDGQGNMYFDLDVPHLSNWNKVWLRSSNENNYIKAQITLSGTEDDGIVLTTHYDVLIESPPTTSGEISLNEMWAGNLTITGDITIQEDILLYIAPESIIEFSSTDDQSGGYNSSKCELIVDGTLDAEGTTFTAENTRDWYGIRFNSTASNCKLDSCTIENGDYNVRITGSSPLIDQCTFDGGLYAVIVESDGADPTVRKCDIKNVNYGIRLQTDTEGDYYDNKISTLSRGIYIYNGDGNFYSNSINYSGGYGVCVLGSYANPDITGTYTGSERGNYFDSNMGNDVIYVGSGSPILGYGTPSGACGYNLFEDVPTGYYYIDNNTGSSLQAEYNYWHDGTEPDDSDFDGAVDYTPYEDTEPDAGTTWKRNVASSLYAEALQAYRHRDYEKVITLVPQAIEQDADHPLAHPVLNRYFSALRNQNKLSMQEINSTLTPGYSDDIQQIARGWKIRYYAENDQMNNAEKLALSVSKNSSFERVLLLDVLYFYARFDETEAIERIKNILTVRHKDDTISEDIEAAIDAGHIDKLVYPEHLPKRPAAESESLPKKLTIVNYPNPCNPTTTILFTLPKDGHVKIDIYNTRGQKVRSLADNHFSKGQHTVQWKGRNDFNSQVATGVYFYHVRLKDQAITKKLLLLQ